jgi:O-antigen/teichoic acid export membrane protein
MLTGSGGSQALHFILTLFLARILAPEEFAAVALITSVLAIANTFTEMGLSVAVVQRVNDTPELFDSAFTLTIVFFVFISSFIFFLSEPAAKYYQLSILSPLSQIAAIAFFFQGLKSFYRSLLLRQYRFKAISIAEIVAVTINGFVAIVMAMKGYGAYSIVWGVLSSQIATFVILFLARKYTPQSLGSLKIMQELLSFGAWVSIGRILGTAAGQFDRFLIGKILSEKELGGYHIASRLTFALPSLLTSIVDQVLLPLYSEAKNEAKIIEYGYWKGLRYSTILIIPASLLIAVFSRPLIFLFLGEKWLFTVPIVRIISIFSLFHGMGGGIFASAVYASGLPRLMSIVNLFRIIVLPSCVLVGSQWGIIGVAWGIAAFGFIGRFFNQLLLQIYLGYSYLKFFEVIAKPLSANAGMLLFGLICQSFITFEQPVHTALVTSLLGLLTLSIYFILCWCIMREDIRFLFDQFRKLTRL